MNTVSNPYWNEVLTFPNASLRKGRFSPDMNPGLLENTYNAKRSRSALVMKYSWAIPDPETIEWLRGHLANRYVVEIGAGNGYWAYIMSQVGVPFTCYDQVLLDKGEKNHFFAEGTTNFYPVARGDSQMAYLHRRDVLFLCWPPFGGDLAADALRCYAGDTVVYIGEGEGGCCADDKFFELLATQWVEKDVHPIVQWEGMRDYATIFTRRPHTIWEEP